MKTRTDQSYTQTETGIDEEFNMTVKRVLTIEKLYSNIAKKQILWNKDGELHKAIY